MGSKTSPQKPNVALVGAGPGDVDLLTLKAAALLGAADVVLYDALVHPDILQLAARATLVPVGKRKGAHCPQEDINRILVDYARSGQRVVRLKGGDPFVFGRGGEEARALADAGFGFEVVPGISSALAAPCYAGIPVTDRGKSISFGVVSAHRKEDGGLSSEALRRAARGVDTLVVLMAKSRLQEVARICLEQGRPTDQSVALVVDGTRADQQVWLGTLYDFAVAPVYDLPEGPGLLVVGNVAQSPEALRWWTGPQCRFHRHSAPHASSIVGKALPTGRFLVMTGPGKGKSTAAFGLALRSLGHGHQVALAQFIKSDAAVGELMALEQFPGVRNYVGGHGFLPKIQDSRWSKHQNAAQRAWRWALCALRSPKYVTVVLDELNVALDKGLVDQEQVLEAIREAVHGPLSKTVVCTGRGAPEALIALADTVSHIDCVKHAYTLGIPAQLGVEF